MPRNRSLARRFIDRVISEPCRAFWVILGEANVVIRWIAMIVIALLLVAIGVLSMAPELPR